jgi:hypothetical protein
MSHLFLTLIFSLLALTGFGLIVYGIRLKPARSNETAGNENDIVLEFSDVGGGSPEIIDLESGPDSIQFDEKKHFDPGKHRPEKIESKKADEGN